MIKLTLPLILLTLMSGCATQRMDINDLSTYKVDCANKDAQIRFLESQITTPNDRLASMFMFDRQQASAMTNREYDAVAKKLIWDLKTHCSSEDRPWRKQASR